MYSTSARGIAWTGTCNSKHLPARGGFAIPRGQSLYAANRLRFAAAGG